MNFPFWLRSLPDLSYELTFFLPFRRSQFALVIQSSFNPHQPCREGGGPQPLFTRLVPAGDAKHYTDYLKCYRMSDVLCGVFCVVANVNKWVVFFRWVTH